jgi:hypothetical protein
MINERLFEHYGIDTHKDMRISTVCARPFDTVLIDKQGSCYACECTAWLPQSIGNLQIKPLAEILGSDIHQHLRSSVTDGTYRYCNNKQCAYIKANNVREKEVDHIRHLRLGIDESCNLRCPSCRKGMIFHKDGSAYNIGIRLADRINDWLHSYDHPIQVHIGSDGDPFASHVYRHFMEQTPQRDNIKYSILTNGLMFKEFHDRVPYVISNLKDLGVSIDGATKGTYESLRLGGKWDKVNEGLECMAELKRTHGFHFALHMVVQQANWREMPLMLRMAEELGADRVFFNKIEDWNTNVDHSLQTFTEDPEFIALLRQVIAHPLAHNNVISV